jgi:DNA-binding MarR family transcriptional regulator
VSYAVLTDEGVRKVEEARLSHQGDIDELFGAALSPQEREQLGELLARLPLAPTAQQCAS